MSDQYDQNDNQLDGFEEPAAAAGSKPAPQTFRVVVTVFGIVFVLVILALIAFVLLRPSGGGSTEVSRRNTENAMIALNATATANAYNLEQTVAAAAAAATKAAVTNTPVVLPPSATVPVVATSTSVVAVATITNTLAPSATLVPPESQTKTAAALTQVALGTKPVGGAGTTPTAGTAAAGTPGAGTPAATKTGLPATGFADQNGLPAMIGAAVLLMVVIFIARRLRASN